MVHASHHVVSKQIQASDDQYKIQANLCKQFTVRDYVMIQIRLEWFPRNR
jgi:hypothetical protein